MWEISSGWAAIIGSAITGGFTAVVPQFWRVREKRRESRDAQQSAKAAAIEEFFAAAVAERMANKRGSAAKDDEAATRLTAAMARFELVVDSADVSVMYMLRDVVNAVRIVGPDDDVFDSATKIGTASMALGAWYRQEVSGEELWMKYCEHMQLDPDSARVVL